MDFCVTKTITFAGDESGNTKVLGLCWHTGGDYFGCEPCLDPPTVFTKRGILSLTARIFDQLGLFAPTIFLAKHIMQRMWQAEYSWDECLPEDIHKDWEQFVAKLRALTSEGISRYFNITSGSTCSLYGFCDASQRGCPPKVRSPLEINRSSKTSCSMVSHYTLQREFMW